MPSISGSVTVDGVAVSAELRIYKADSGELVGIGSSDINGDYQLNTGLYDCYVMCIPEAGYQPVVHGPITPSGADIVGPTDILNSYYSMDNISGGVVIDETGQHPATIVGASIVAGVDGNAMYFAAPSDRLEGAGIIGGIPEWAIVAICYPDGSDGTLFEYDWADPKAGSAIILNEPSSSRLRFLYRYSASSSVVITAPPLIDESVNCVIFGVEGDEIYVEVNGARYSAPFGYDVAPAADAPFTIGNRETNSHSFGGWVDFFVSYNAPLSADDKAVWESYAS